MKLWMDEAQRLSQVACVGAPGLAPGSLERARGRLMPLAAILEMQP